MQPHNSTSHKPKTTATNHTEGRLGKIVALMVHPAINNARVKTWRVLAGWWLNPTPLKKVRVKVTWDDDIPKINGKIKVMFQSPPTSLSWLVLVLPQ